MTDQITAEQRAALETIVAEADTGGRKPTGLQRQIMFATAIGWSLFQLWFASPLPYILGIGIINDSQARPIHLSFAFALVFMTFPAFAKSPRRTIPFYDWVLAILAVSATLYLIVFYNDIAMRPGLPTTADIVVTVIGVTLVIEAARRAVGPAMAVIACLMIVYIFMGPWLPGLLAHKGATFSRVASQMWLTSEGIFGVALGVSTSFVFLFVLFGALLEKAGAGNYFIQLAFSLLGHYRGGPAKAGVVASGMTGMISGSSIANTVTVGTFTIPLMKRVGYTPTKAGAIEAAAGVNGQLMPPVMGAAAFLIAEYVGISYIEVVKHAILPAILTYGSLFYIVDIEAAKAGMRGLPRTHAIHYVQTSIRGLMTICSIIILSAAVYYGLGWTKTAFGEAATWIMGAVLIGVYVLLLWRKAKYPDLSDDDPNQAILKVPNFYETARTGLHFLLPVIVLIWCLMVEEMSAGLSAFWGTALLVFVVITHRPIVAAFRSNADVLAAARQGGHELFTALEAGARNMTGVALATATAGIIVGTVALTGFGLLLTELVEILSGGNLVLMLLLTAVICLILGMGMPTTANYIVVSTLMAPVLVELAAQNDLAIPLVAVHMFVFYFGLMADVTPPVGLAAYAAAAIAGADPVKTGVQAFRFIFPTGLLPFIFIYNTGILMIDIGGPLHFVVVVTNAIVAIGCFVAATQNWLLVRNRWYESVVLLIVCFTLFRPTFWLNMVSDPYQELPGREIVRVAAEIPAGGTLRIKAETANRAGDMTIQVLRLSMGPGGSGQEKLANQGMTVRTAGDSAQIATVRFRSEAAKLNLAAGDEIKTVYVPTERINPYWLAVPAYGLIALIVFLQRRRRGNISAAAAVTRAA
ncbi:TRAP transporter permease [Xanthobacteraceae bacterium Astr-EGSB]|uniref:TRAP transporter permease n=1 Tax=Astrobacterium formosum TaxID=3069710 RepID=UPI0027AF0D22|nr:TRAP transporter permease [Xanthobacteraceae bacterium Astr-EGSB]